jgi:NAD(P)-dependent dehydrogenase (short-subunit alcohol dehydrogenase family)
MPNAERTVLTTGANSGLGLATAIEIARRGYRSIGSVRDDAKAATVHAAALAAGVTVETVLLDVTDAARCAAVVDEIGPVYGLVNNAGYSVTGAIEDVTDDEARAVLETMVIAPMRLARLVLPAMRERRSGRIVMISSIYGRTTTPFTGWYQAAKHAVEGATDALRMEVAGFGVKVVLVEPGGFRTAIFDEVSRDIAKRGGSPYTSAYERMVQANRMAQPFLGDPVQVARLVGRLLAAANPRARYLIGLDAQAAALSERFAPTFLSDLVNRRVLGL